VDAAVVVLVADESLVLEGAGSSLWWLSSPPPSWLPSSWGWRWWSSRCDGRGTDGHEVESLRRCLRLDQELLLDLEDGGGGSIVGSYFTPRSQIGDEEKVAVSRGSRWFDR